MNTKFNWQSFISLGLLFSFIILSISGIILYIAPEGSLSRWIGWDVLNLTKKQWEHQHTIFSYLFILFSIFHIFKINWGILIYYFSQAKFKLANLKEIIAAIVITVLVFFGTQYDWYPFSTIVQIGNEISDSYSRNVEIPDFPDAEKLSLTDFAEHVFKVTYPDLESKLVKYNFTVSNEDVSVVDFCSLNNITPDEFYVLIKNDFKNTVEKHNALGGSVEF
ncbi:MAG TPA: hypothetical protein DCG75_09045 [Bacteroidales bacterium]|nr:hypothetical protein [Bacteroidales bacterium]